MSAAGQIQTVPRFVRLCAQHGCTISVVSRTPCIKSRNAAPVYFENAFLCRGPQGAPSPHECRAWVTYDSVRKKVYGAATFDRVFVLEGECEDALLALREKAPRKKVNRFRDQPANGFGKW